MNKICKRCNDEKPIDEFPTQIKRGKRITLGNCRTCVNAQQRESYLRHHESRKERLRLSHAQNRERNNAKAREYNAAHREERKRFYQENRELLGERHWKSALKRRYGITFEQYEQMLRKQDGKCALCGSTEPWTRSRRFAVDHDHATGKVRGLLCHLCNRGIGNLKDDPVLLRKAAKYVERHRR